MEVKQVLEAELILDGELMERFRRIKEYLGLTDDAEVLRFIIRWFFKERLGKTPK
jgi:hypothetical protein